MSRNESSFTDFQGHKAFGINNGMEGLAEGKLKEMDWSDVNGWVGLGGAKLGTKRTLPDKANIDKIAQNMSKFGLQGLVLIGGFEAYQVLNCLCFLCFPIS